MAHDLNRHHKPIGLTHHPLRPGVGSIRDPMPRNLPSPLARITHLVKRLASEHRFSMAVVLELQPIAGRIDQEKRVVLQQFASKTDPGLAAKAQA